MPIIRSLLDTDWYKLTMDQFVLHQFPNVPVTYSFHCRTPDARLTDFIDIGRLKEEFQHMASLRFLQPELAFLARQRVDKRPLFRADFLDHLTRLRLDQYSVEVVDDTFRIEFEGNWVWSMLWETFCLSIISELYYEGLRKKAYLDQHDVLNVGLKRLADKEVLLAEYPNLVVTDFGTRRRYSRLWQEIVIDHMIKTIPKQLGGTSNAYLAWQYGLPPIGTMAHELDQAVQGIILKETGGDYSKLTGTRNRVKNAWEKEYPYDLRINLPDTFSSDWELDHTTKKRLEDWKGERHDSGNPFSFAEKRIEKWRNYGIDPRDKVIVFSDGLNERWIMDLYEKFRSKTNVAFGIGTNLTNDMGLKPISIVVKLTKSCGYGTVKLSDNWNKAIGKPEDIERVKQVFGLTEGEYQEVKY